MSNAIPHKLNIIIVITKPGFSLFFGYESQVHTQIRNNQAEAECKFFSNIFQQRGLKKDTKNNTNTIVIFLVFIVS